MRFENSQLFVFVVGSFLFAIFVKLSSFSLWFLFLKDAEDELSSEDEFFLKHNTFCLR